MKIWFDKPIDFDHSLDTFKYGDYERGALANLKDEQNWYHALPIGNGSLGAMVYGGVGLERIQMNQDTIWAGPPCPENPEGMYKVVEEARKLIFEGNYAQADKIVQEVMPERIAPRSYQPLGDIFIENNHTECSDYKRSLDLTTGVVTTSYISEGTTYQEKVFCSYKDEFIIVKLAADKGNALTANITLNRIDDKTVSVRDENIYLNGQASHDGEHLGVKFGCVLKPIIKGGSYTFEGNILKVKDADSITLFLTAATDYNRKNPSEALNIDLYDVALEKMNTVINHSTCYEVHFDEHIELFKEMFDRVEFSLDGEESSLPTDERLQAVKDGKKDNGLIELYYQYGRYLIMSSSRNGSMAANLQGIWNAQLEAPWHSDYHININIQMIYWHVQACNLAECHLPYFELIESLVENGQETAKKVYNCRGFTAHHTTDAWLWTGPIGELLYGMWPMAGGWCSRQFLEYYNYTGDIDFLRNRTLPIIKEASLFYLDWLVKHPKLGKLVSGPCTSPENKFKIGDDHISLSMGCSMDQEIIWETFNNFILCCEILGEQDELLDEIKEARDNLLWPGIGDDGRLMEWSEQFEEVWPGHRHISHLYGLYPSYMFADNDDYLDASSKTLVGRLSHGGGHTGWSRAWIINLYARLKDSEKAYENIIALLQKSTLDNLFDTHAPFQIDGNFGATAGINEMLIQSHGKYIELLPTLPEEWSTGSIKGIRARGGFEFDIEWNQGKITKCNVKSLLGNSCIVKFGEKTVELNTTKGQNVDIKF